MPRNILLDWNDLGVKAGRGIAVNTKHPRKLHSEPLKLKDTQNATVQANTAQGVNILIG